MKTLILFLGKRKIIKEKNLMHKTEEKKQERKENDDIIDLEELLID